MAVERCENSREREGEVAKKGETENAVAHDAARGGNLILQPR